MARCFHWKRWHGAALELGSGFEKRDEVELNHQGDSESSGVAGDEGKRDDYEPS